LVLTTEWFIDSVSTTE